MISRCFTRPGMLGRTPPPPQRHLAAPAHIPRCPYPAAPACIRGWGVSP